MSSYKDIYQRWLEAAELAFIQAKQEGMIDPVIRLEALHHTDPGLIEVKATERDELIRLCDSTCVEEANFLRSNPPRDGYFTIVVANLKGPTTYERPIPV